MNSREMTAAVEAAWLRRTRLEWSLRTIGKLHHQADGRCAECDQRWPCPTILEINEALLNDGSS